MDTYYVCGNLNHNGKAYQAGDKISLSSEFAESLLTEGIISTEKPEGAAPKPVEELAEKEGVVPQVGGEPLATGEPSMDGQTVRAAPTETKDLTQDVEPNLDDMTKAELQELAEKEGVDPAAVKKAWTKGALVTLIKAHRTEEHDPSANL